MINQGPKSRYQCIEHYIKTIQDEGKELSTWEEAFVDSVNEQFLRKGDISDKQYEIIERIYAEKTP